MKQKVCTFIQRNDLFGDNIHPLHLRSDNVKWLSAFGASDSPCIASLSYERDTCHSHRTKFLVLVHLDHHPDVNQNDKQTRIAVEEETEENIVLLSSATFHEHYEIKPNCPFLVVGVIPVFPLSRIVLCAQTEEAFNWANGATFERGLMVAATCHKYLLVRQGDQFLGQPCKIFGDDSVATLRYFKNLQTIESYPLKQGYIHANTEIIITDAKSCGETIPKYRDIKEATKLKLVTPAMLNGLSLAGRGFDTQNDVLCCPELAEELNIRDHEFISLEVTIPICSEELKENDRSYLHSAVLAPPSYGPAMGNIAIDMPTPEDPQHSDQAPSKFQVICRLRVRQSKSTSVLSRNSCLLDRSTIYISPLVWFNTGYSSNVQDMQVTVRRVDADQLPFAKEIHLALVLSPNYSPSAHFDQALAAHLSRTVILKRNDIISIETSDNVDFLCECDVKDARCQVLFFKVEKFSEEDQNSCQVCFRVDLKHTALYQVGTTSSFIPPRISDDNIRDGLSEYLDEMKDIIAPYVASEMNCSTSTILLSGSPGCGKRTLVSSIANALHLHTLNVSCHELMSDSSGATEAKIITAVQRATVYAPCLFVLSGIECIGKDNETGQADPRVCSALYSAIESLQSERYPVVVVAVTSNIAGVVSKVRSVFLHEVEIKSPSENERKATMQKLVGLTSMGKDVDLQWISKHSVGFTYGELWELLRQAIRNARERIANDCAVGSKLSWIDNISICAAGISCQHCDFEKALQRMQSLRADIIGVPKIPNVKWDDIGGLENVKSIIKDTIQLPLEHPELVSAGLRRSGILLYGPPGTGKTLLAKAVATQCSLSFLSIKGPELINMYVGQSEENVRKVFSRAREAAPCVVFFDELDSLAPNRGRSGDSGGVMDRVVSQLLAELDGLVEADAERMIFVIGASNRPDLIDPALLRPGRFDKLLCVGINSNKDDQLKILEAQSRRTNLSPSVRLRKIVDLCPENMTGADFYALTSEATMSAIRRRIETEEERERNRESGSSPELNMSPLVVEQIDFEKAARNIVPSVSNNELSRFYEIENRLALS